MAKKKSSARDSDDLPILVVEYAFSGSESQSLEKRHALEDWLDELLGEHDLGSCDGGSIGSGTMEVFCDVADYAKAKRLVEREIRATPYAGFARIYKVAPQPKGRSRKGAASMYAVGDCLAVKVPGGHYSAAYVAGADPKGGSHAVIELDYYEKRKPTLAEFSKLEPLVLDHHEWEDELQANVTPRRDEHSDATIEVVGNAKLRLAGVDVGLDRASWVNWKAKVDPDVAEAFPDDPAAGRYLSTTGDWSLGFQVVEQRNWDARKKR
jgi:hypothetical protein